MQSILNKALTILIIGAILIAISSCGGSGGGSGGGSSNNTPGTDTNTDDNSVNSKWDNFTWGEGQWES